MADSYFTLSARNRADALAAAANRSGRPAHLLEKDVWVGWALETLFNSPLGPHLVFKGGTSLSKAFHVIERFSEDVDLTYDIRELAFDLVENHHNALPNSRNQASEWTREIRERLATWTLNDVQPVLAKAINALDRSCRVVVNNDVVDVLYAPLKEGTGYVSPIVRLEFGARSTGEPWELHGVVCDAAEYLPDVSFPLAQPQVMKAERTFWEKATAIHVYCAGGPFRNAHRFSRHWHDLTRLDSGGYADRAIADRALANQVAQHKQLFFREHNSIGAVIDYTAAVDGAILLIPKGQHYEALAIDYARMVVDGLLPEPADGFEQLMEACGRLEGKMNGYGNR